MPASDPPSTAELAFLAMLRRPREFAKWAELVRKDWTAKAARDRPDAGAGPHAESRARLGRRRTTKEPT